MSQRRDVEPQATNDSVSEKDRLVFSADEGRELLELELIQRREEGCNVAGWDRRVKAAGKKLDRIVAVYDALSKLKPAAKLARNEPSDLPAIRKLRPKGPRRINAKITDARLRDRLRGAMLGRCAGCQLGKPVEGWHRDRLFKALEADGSFPLMNYIRRSVILADNPKVKETPWVRETIVAMDRDDDIDYTILGIEFLRKLGPKFTTQDVVVQWMNYLPYYLTYTAERAVYRTFINAVPVDKLATTYNPYREWIGAQIRADGFGYCAAGMPQLAAEFAWRDARLSHVKNGIYGEMLFAAMIAAALVDDDLEEVIAIGLSEIPANCRLAEAVRKVIAWSWQNGDDWQKTLELIHDHYGHYHTVHTINNAALVIMALMHGWYDFENTICLAVMGGWDTDCNGATAGSVIGAILGAKKLPTKWTRPLHNKLRTLVSEWDNGKITDVADAALEVNRKLRRAS